MAMLVSVFGVVYAAACIWLTVRVFNRRERWAKCVLAGVLSLPVLYMLSFLPLFWLEAHGYIHLDSSVVGTACQMYAAPVRLVYEYLPQPVRDALNWYQSIFRQ